MHAGISKISRWSLLIPALFLCACSFNYGDISEDEESSIPDMAMQNFEYVRVRSNMTQVRLQGESAERWEKNQTMTINQLRFAQYSPSDGKSAAVGLSGKASIDLASGDVSFSDGVQIVIEAEGLTIETQSLSWYGKDRIMMSGDDEAVLIKKTDGSLFSGKAFGADARRRSWEFASGVAGQTVEDFSQAEKTLESASGAASSQETPAPAKQEGSKAEEALTVKPAAASSPVGALP